MQFSRIKNGFNTAILSHYYGYRHIFTCRGGENSKINPFRRFAFVFFCFFQQHDKKTSNFCISNKIFGILKQDLKAFCIIKRYTEVFRTLYRSF